MKTFDELKTLIDQRGVHEVFGAPGEGYGIEQEASELAHFLVHMQELGVQSILEIGTGYRAGLARFLHDDMGWQVFSIDVKDYGHQFAGIQFTTDRRGVIGHYDLVLIDADHSYEGVKADHAYYGVFAEIAVAFHDICGLRDCEGVEAYWRRLAKSASSETTIIGGIEHTELGYNLKPGYYEIAAEGDQRGGIGYIVLAEANAEFERQVAELEANAPKATDGADASTEPQPPPPPPAKPKPTRKPAAKKPAAKKAAVKK